LKHPGQSYRLVRRCYDAATVVGWVASGSDGSNGGAAGALCLNPPDGQAVPAGSQLVFVAGGMDDALTPLDQPYEVQCG
jgi:FAD/FMN-containing dehydrogenase